jgi:hypothetical protein
VEGGLTALDWAQPWYGPWRAPGEATWGAVSSGKPVHEALNAVGAAPVRFTPAASMPPDRAYEEHVRTTGECPTRDNLHDFFNGLCWIALPRSKARLNELQAAEIARDGIGGRRGPVRDAITVLDENGVLLQAPAPLWEALLARHWRELFVTLRPLWNETRVLVVGHALLEKLAAPRKNLTGHVWAQPCPSVEPAQADAWLAGQLTPEVLARKPFTPLPVLGIPGWCADNANFSFYDDSEVFRARTVAARGPAGA